MAHINIVIGGEAGQGLATIGHTLARSLVRGGYYIVVTQTYLSRIRGGNNSFAIRASDRKIEAPAEKIDILAALDENTIKLRRNELQADGVIIADESHGGSFDRLVPVPFSELSGGKHLNVAAMGVAGQMMGIDREIIASVLDDQLGKKKEAIRAENRKALYGAFAWAEKRDIKCKKLGAPDEPAGRIMLNGNEAIALGALTAGVKFCSYYPMTPATGVAQALIDYSRNAALLVEQAEDEIAAINMALGASYAGAPAIVPTSGGGFALMAEGLSLSGATETPVVIVLAQRPGPATGLPTRAEQGDLDFALHAGHGEFPRAVFAPGSPKECVHLTRKAFQLAERYQSPAIVLTDQFLADSYRAIDAIDPRRLKKTVFPLNHAKITDNYRRYEITPSGVSPRLIPGQTRALVRADSDEHNEEGLIEESPSNRVAMADKRNRKMTGLRDEVIPPQIGGDDRPDLLLVNWGSTKGAVAEAAQMFRNNGRKIATMHFNQLWPLVGDHFLGLMEKAGSVVCVEGNATGQFAALVRRQTGFHIKKQVLRYDGMPHTPEYIARKLDKIL